MRSLRLTLAGIVIGLVACSDGTTPSLISDAEITADVAASSGDAIASALETLTGNQLTGMLPYSVNDGDPVASDVTADRLRTCYDAAGAVVPNCSPLSAVRKIVTRVAISGSRSGTRTTDGGATITWSGAVHRVMDDTLTRNFNTAQPPAEVSRTHTGISTGNDTSTFTDGSMSRNVAETFTDSVRAVTFNLPRSSNPWPVSGSIVRNVSVTATVTKEGTTRTRSLTRRVQVTFPPDAQGNVVLQINSTTCNLNLVTKRVTGCS